MRTISRGPILYRIKEETEFYIFGC